MCEYGKEQISFHVLGECEPLRFCEFQAKNEKTKT